MKLDLSAEGWGRVIVYTVLGTLVCVIAALYVDSFNFGLYSDEERNRSIVIDIVLPIMLAVPLLLFFTSKLRELAIAHKRLTIYASTDSLTQVMNRAAFSTLVDAYLNDVRAAEKAKGAFLIIDADDFKSVNDRFGHERGDEVVRAIASVIRDRVDTSDLVGRMDGEEFAVYLRVASERHAAEVAETIRTGVETVDLGSSEAQALSVSVGLATADGPIPFMDLFRLADRQLLAAKQNGRNRVAITAVEPVDRDRAAA